MAIYEKLVDDTLVLPLADHVGLYADEADEEPYFIQPDGTKVPLKGATGATGPTGATGADGSQILHGSGVPGGGLGADGDFYLDDDTGDYYSKAAGAWTLAGNLKGGVGDQGPPGAPGTSASDQGTYLISGGGVAFLQDFDFRVSASAYRIAGVNLTSAQADVTLDAPDGTFDRFDAIVVDDTGVVAVVEGTPSANPEFPDIDPLTQLALTYVLVPTGATEPVGATTTNIYREDGEWTATPNNASINKASTNNPFAGTKDIEATAAANGHRVDLVNGATISLADKKQLVLQIRSKASWPNQKALRLTWMNGATKIGQLVAIGNNSFGFVSTNTTSYQQIVIPISAFTVPAASVVDTLRVEVAGGGAAIGWYLDDIILEHTSGGITPVNVFPASATASGTVKTDSTVSDPTVYLKDSVDTLLATKSGTGHTHSTLPSSDEKDALAGTDGTPSAANPYVTDSDSRLGAGGGAGALTLLASLTASASSFLTFTTRNAAGQSGDIFQSDYEEYVIVLKHIIPTTTDTTLLCQFSSDGGSSWPTGKYWHAVIYAAYGSSHSIFQETAQNELNLTLEGTGMTNNAGWGVCGKLDMWLGNGTLFTRLSGLITFAKDSDGNQMLNQFGGLVLTGSWNAVRFYISSGTIASGTIRIYGVAK